MVFNEIEYSRRIEVMKKFSTAIIGLTLVANSIFATDVVRLRNGDVFKGEVVEQNTIENFIQLRFSDGNEKRINMNQVESIKKDEAQPHQKQIISQRLREPYAGKGLVTAGGIIWAATYGATVGYAAFNSGTTAFIPLVGPWLQLSNTRSPGLCIISGSLQSVGALLMLIGAVQGSSGVRESEASVAPYIAPNLTGVSIAYRF